MIRIALIGGNGYIGRCLVEQLSKNDLFEKIVIIDKDSSFSNDFTSHKIIFYKSDLFELKKTYKIALKHDINIILDVSSDYEPDEFNNNIINFYENNVGKLMSIFKLSRYAHIKKMIFISNVFLDEKIDEKNHYLFSKKSGEQILKNSCDFHNISYCFIRTSSVIGSYSKIRKLSKYNIVSNSFIDNKNNFSYSDSNKNNFVNVNNFCSYIKNQILDFFGKDKNIEKNYLSKNFYDDNVIFEQLSIIKNDDDKKEPKHNNFKFSKIDDIDESNINENILDEINIRKLIG